MLVFALTLCGFLAAIAAAEDVNVALLPRIGLGTAGLRGRTALVVTAALRQGVRLIDTAQAQEWYDEKSVADAIKTQTAVTPIIVTKIHPRSFERQAMRRALATSAKHFEGLGLHTVLLHSPFCWEGHCTPQEEAVHWSTAWRNLESLQKEFGIKSIGVSNFDAHQLRDLLGNVAHAKVSVIQNWMDPFHQDRAVRELAKAQGIQYMAYSSFGTQWSRRGNNPVFESDLLQSIAKKHNCSVAKVVLAWLLQEGVVAIPRTSNVEHIEDNFGLCKEEDTKALCDGSAQVDDVETFLTAEDIEAIRSLDGSIGLPWE